MRYRYVTSESLMTANISMSQTYTLSSEVDRTLMSSTAHGLGLYPPGTGISLSAEQIVQAVPPITVSNLTELQEELGSAALPYFAAAFPIHGELISESYILRPFSGGCAKVTQFDQSLLMSKNVTAFYSPYGPLLAKLETLLNLSASSIQADMFYIYDSVTTNQFHGFNISTLTKSDVTGIQDIWNNTIKYILSASDEMNRLAGSSFLQELIWQFNGVIENVCCDVRRFSTYVSDSYSMMMILATLGISDQQIPPYASILLFEIIESHPIPNPAYSVLVTLNDIPVLIPTCPSIKCPFDTFMKYVTFRTFPDVQDLCVVDGSIPWSSTTNSSQGNLISEGSDSHMGWTVWFALAVMIVVALAAGGFVWLRFRQSQQLLRERSRRSTLDSDFKLSMH
jgi:hypothetical protein